MTMIKHLLGSVWTWLAAALGILSVALLASMGRTRAAKEKLKKTRDDLHSTRVIQDAERTIAREQQAAREQSAEKRDERKARPSGQRPTGSFRRK